MNESTGCPGCLGFLTITLATLAVLVYATVNDQPLVMSAAGVLLWLIMITARWYRGIK